MNDKYHWKRGLQTEDVSLFLFLAVNEIGSIMDATKAFFRDFFTLSSIVFRGLFFNGEKRIMHLDFRVSYIT